MSLRDPASRTADNMTPGYTTSVTSSRSALITGGSSGIGLAVARMLAARGYALTISGRRPEKLDAAAGELRSEGFHVLAKPAQMGDEEEVAGLVEAHRERFGGLDVLVNNAGVGIAQPTDRIQTKHLDMQLAVNLRGAIIATRECLGMLREAGAEHGKALVVNMASLSGKDGVRGLAVYSATKAALIALSESTQKDVSGTGVQVTALCPGLVDTPMSANVGESTEQMVRPEDVARAVAFLLDTSPNCFVPEMVLVPPGPPVPAFSAS
jgi:NAD(P)-dependent dehydrogenase (short-subunit alcohol dehydrogenase family)